MTTTDADATNTTLLLPLQLSHRDFAEKKKMRTTNTAHRVMISDSRKP